MKYIVSPLPCKGNEDTIPTFKAAPVQEWHCDVNTLLGAVGEAVAPLTCNVALHKTEHFDLVY